MWAQFARQGGDMTARAVFTKVCQEGRQILRNVLVKYQKVAPTQVPAKPSAIKRGQDLHIKQTTVQPFSSVLRQFIPRDTQSLASQLSRNFARRSPLLAFVGLSLASGLQDQEDEVVDTIHNTVKDLSSVHGKTTLLDAFQRTGLSFGQLAFGKLIGKGCNAAVYEAKLKHPVETETVEEAETTSNMSKDDIEDVSVIEGSESDIEDDADQSAPTEWTPKDLMGQQLERFLLIGEEGKEEEVSDNDSIVSFEVLEEGRDLILEEIAAMDSEMNEGVSSEKNETLPPQHSLAVKKMFNYDVESNAASILRAMEKETVPAKLAHTHSQMDQWENGNKFRKKRKKELPPHPNIVDMWGVFVGPVTCLAESLEQYPAALPPRISQHGLGRNSTLYLVMKKYDMTLREYLTCYNPSLETRMMLLLQLLEGVAHLGQHEIAHRDMKSDNILLSNIDGLAPELVISDFGCCLADPDHGLKLPYPTEEVDKGGNTALMPPEILCKEPGRFSVLDYSRADIWSAGALAYEIFGLGNPFYGDQGGKLHSRTYRQRELPALPDNIPLAVRKLVRSMLARNPQKRPSPAMAASVLHMLLWMPPDWLLPSNRVTMSDIKWWLVTMTAEVTLEHCFHGYGSQELALKTTFLQRLNMNIIGEAWSLLNQTL